MRCMVVKLVVVEEDCMICVIELEQVFQVASPLVGIGLNIVDLN